MFHFARRARKGLVLFHDHTEAHALWTAMSRAFPDVIAMCLMPDHVHLILPTEARLRFARAASGYTRWLVRRGGPRHLWDPIPPPVRIPDPAHLRRTVRYVLLNPCRAGLVPDPLSWPWSTHRDRVGLTAFPVGPIDRDPVSFHAWVSGDPAVAIAGTALPVAPEPAGFDWDEVCQAACAVLRVVPGAEAAADRRLELQVAWMVGMRDIGRLCDHAAASRSVVYAAVAGLGPPWSPAVDRQVAMSVRVLGDGRFGWTPLDALPGAGRYAGGMDRAVLRAS